MSSLQPWFQRKFAFDLPNSRFQIVLERLRGTPARVEERVRSLSVAILVTRIDDKWSIQENLGHLSDLEPLWTRRAEQIFAGESELMVADLTNRGTVEARHNDQPIEDILNDFRERRFRLLSILESTSPSVLELTARHPRLGTPMRLIDVAFFTAEHDDHHMARVTELLRLLT